MRRCNTAVTTRQPGKLGRVEHHAAGAGVDRRHAAVAVDADAVGLAAGGELVDQVGLAQQGPAHGHEVEAQRHRLLHGLAAVDAAEQHQRHRAAARGSAAPCRGSRPRGSRTP